MCYQEKIGKLNLTGQYGRYKKEIEIELKLNWIDGIYGLK